MVLEIFKVAIGLTLGYFMYNKTFKMNKFGNSPNNNVSPGNNMGNANSGESHSTMHVVDSLNPNVNNMNVGVLIHDDNSSVNSHMYEAAHQTSESVDSTFVSALDQEPLGDANLSLKSTIECSSETVTPIQCQVSNEEVKNEIDISHHDERTFDTMRNTVPEESVRLVIFDIETGGLEKDCDILQIAAKCGKYEFNKYCKPTQEISPRASGVTGLTTFEGDLFLHGKPVHAIPVFDALKAFHAFLTLLGGSCILIAHNALFDSARLLLNVAVNSMQKDFSDVIIGFTDSLSLIRSKTGRKGLGSCTLSGLAEWKGIAIEGAHDALCDVKILEQLLALIDVTDEELISNHKTYTEFFIKNSPETSVIMKDLNVIPGLSSEMKWRMAVASISLETLKEIFKEKGQDGITEILTRTVKGKPVVTKNKKIMGIIIDFLEKHA